MKQIDRFLRIIYKDFPLQQVLSKKLDQSTFETFFSQRWSTSFWLSEHGIREKSDYLDEVKKLYRETYHDYNDDEIDSLLAGYAMESKKVSPRGFEDNTLNLLLYAADQLIFYQNGKATIRFRDLLEWNGIINKVDANILFAIKAAKDGREILPTDSHKAYHDNHRLNKILSEGISDNHMHLKGSGYTSDMNWHDFSTEQYDAYNQKKTQAFFDILKSFASNYESEELAFLKINVIKFYLFKKYVLSCENTDNFNSNFLKLLQTETREAFELLYSGVSDELEEIVVQWETHYDYLKHTPKQAYLVERCFLKDLFIKYLNGKMSHFEVYLFNCYLLATNRFKKFFNQDNEGMGFEKFKRSENIKESLLKNDDNKRIYRAVFDKYYSEGAVKKVEFRVAPKYSLKAYNQLVRELDGANKEIAKNFKCDELLKYGIIVHFIKDKGDFNPENGISRKEKSYANLNNQVSPLLAYFDNLREVEHDNKHDEVAFTNKIVGVDTANYELNVRPEIFGPSFRLIRSKIKQYHHFGITYHAGEDFKTLANGLRAMDEVIEFLNYGPGDRFGHGLALGLNVEKFFKMKRNTIISNIEEYFDDIVWMIHFIKKNLEKVEVQDFIAHLNFSSYDILSSLEQEFYTLLGYYHFEKDYSLYDFYQAYKLRGDDPEVYLEYHDKWDYDMVKKYCDTRINFKDAEHRMAANNPKARELYLQYHYSDTYKKNHDKSFHSEASPVYIEAVKFIQFILRLKVYKGEIGVEGNPTSNRKISFISKYIDLPLLELNSRYLKPDSKYDISISINTDDSAIFQTDLSQEYAYVLAALLEEGYDIENAYQYIDYIRDLSLKQSFIKDND